MSMRDELKKAYPGKSWAEEVDKMSIGQVADTYTKLRLRSYGKVGR